MREEAAVVGERKGAENYREGHRRRLRARYREADEVRLQDYELLVLLLTYAIPRWDTKLLAKKLLERFGTLAFLRFRMRDYPGEKPLKGWH